ncbi:hypothetical protein [Planococcus lenghuensis]|uniref:Uncharacterized protein n=1 Tax=Planococcus lenghuensis TaxID=2213202 RepID=A0A1Q2KV60_9BACL|nr:hypothetical protein [Planococcus lenghuensis]AQQ52108.1 hypothetical protein B0X71_02525 [Planococcus lenghuensis]
MARTKGLLLAGLAAGTYAYLKKPENREKATTAFNNAKAKVNSYMESQNLDKTGNDDENVTHSRSGKLAGKDEQPDRSPGDSGLDDGKQKLSPNDVGDEKEENTESVAPIKRVNTENL